MGRGGKRVGSKGKERTYLIRDNRLGSLDRRSRARGPTESKREAQGRADENNECYDSCNLRVYRVAEVGEEWTVEGTDCCTLREPYSRREDGRVWETEEQAGEEF